MADLSLTEKTTREQLLLLLNGGSTHAQLEDALRGLPAKLRGVTAPRLPYSIWQLVDHMRIVQWDILKLSTNPDHASPKWPEGFWSMRAQPKSEDEWQECVDQIWSDRQKFTDLIADEEVDIFEPFPTEEEQSIFKYALMLADHTSYHIGQIVLMRRLLNDWQ